MDVSTGLDQKVGKLAVLVDDRLHEWRSKALHTNARAQHTLGGSLGAPGTRP